MKKKTFVFFIYLLPLLLSPCDFDKLRIIIFVFVLTLVNLCFFFIRLFSFICHRIFYLKIRIFGQLLLQTIQIEYMFFYALLDIALFPPAEFLFFFLFLELFKLFYYGFFFLRCFSFTGVKTNMEKKFFLRNCFIAKK